MSTTTAPYHASTRVLHARSDGASTDLIAIVQTIASEVSTARFFAVALATVLVYHSIITLDKEVRYFWSKLRNSVSLVYFINRYVGVIGAILSITGKISFWIISISNWIIVVLIDYILLIRVLALFHQDKKLSIILKTLLGLDAATGFGLVIRGGVFEETTAFSVVEGLTVCSGKIPPQSETIISWIIPLTFGLVLLVLAIWKAAEYWKLSTGLKGFNLVRVVVQDQLLYYAFAISCCILRIINICIVGANPIVASTIAAVASPTLLCVLGGQLLINLKEAGERGANGGTNYMPTKSVSGIDFGENVAADQGSTERASSV